MDTNILHVFATDARKMKVCTKASQNPTLTTPVSLFLFLCKKRNKRYKRCYGTTSPIGYFVKESYKAPLIQCFSMHLNPV